MTLINSKIKRAFLGFEAIFDKHAEFLAWFLFIQPEGHIILTKTCLLHDDAPQNKYVQCCPNKYGPKLREGFFIHATFDHVFFDNNRVRRAVVVRRATRPRVFQGLSCLCRALFSASANASWSLMVASTPSSNSDANQRASRSLEALYTGMFIKMGPRLRENTNS